MAAKKTKAPANEPNKGGRPPKLVADDKTLKTIRALGKIEATTRDCAAFLDVSEPTFLKFKADHASVEEAYEEGKRGGRVSLRMAQYRLAVDKLNPTMLIWLGKQLLEQTDRREVTGKGGNPIEHSFDLSGLTDEQLDVLASVFGPLAESAADDEADQSGEGTTTH